MGNAGSANVTRERHKSSSSDIIPGSPSKEGQAFVFDRKQDARLMMQGSQEDEEPYYTKPATQAQESASSTPLARHRSSTQLESTMPTYEPDFDKKPALPTVFKWDGGGQQVFISGTFSNWKPLPMVKSHGDFVTIIDLPEGDHEYKFCVDGNWKHDPKLKNIENDVGTKNNLVSVRQSDFEVFQALAKDSEDATNQGQKEYSQDIPQVKPWEKVSGPPVLPPHLLQVILNKDTPLSIYRDISTMGNAGSANVTRERHKSSSSDIIPGSPSKEGQAFVFDRKQDARLMMQGSQEDEEPYYTKPATQAQESASSTPLARHRSSTQLESTMPTYEPDFDKKPALPTVFKWDGGGQQVFISGTFSNWKPLPMVKSHGDFVTIIDLPEGDHEYKFCVDGNWKHDPKLKNIENDVGTKNNLVSVRQSDFEVFQALAKDSEDATNQGQKEYSQDIPQVKPWEKVSGPPVLPPHLLQVILNKDTPLSCEPTLLPEPNHVMLNHLYALSIKDGVMVLSATHRYRKKYVTTLLYKPI